MNNYAYNVVVSNNVLDGYGIAGNDSSGAFTAYTTGGLVVVTNLIKSSAEAAVSFISHNTSFNCSGNLVDGVISSTAAYAIIVRGGDNDGVIVANRVAGLPIYVNPDPSNHVTVADNALVSPGQERRTAAGQQSSR